MNRTDRLYVLVEELRARAPQPVRAVTLAARFEVSSRTIERDLLALQGSGVPIWAQPGPGGGYGLHREATLPPLNLTAAEATALATALAVSPDLPFAAAGRSALQKLLAVMPASAQAAAQALASQIRIGPAESTLANDVASTLQQALSRRVAVRLAYTDKTGEPSERVVESVGLVRTPTGWYLVAWCRLRQAPRVFRLDRIVAATVTDEPVIARSLDAMLAELPYAMTTPAFI